MGEIFFDGKLSKGKIAYERLAGLQNKIISATEKEISVRMANEGRCGKTFVFLIACLRHLGLAYKKILHITVPHKIYNYLGDLEVLRPAKSLSQAGYRFTVFDSDSDSTLMASVEAKARFVSARENCYMYIPEKRIRKNMNRWPSHLSARCLKWILMRIQEYMYIETNLHKMQMGLYRIFESKSPQKAEWSLL